MAMKKCPFCGMENSDSTLFCEFCGSRLETEPEETIYEPIVPNEEIEEELIDDTAVVDEVVEIDTVQEPQQTDYQESTEDTCLSYSNPVHVNNHPYAVSNYKRRSNNRQFIIIILVIAVVVIGIIAAISFGRKTDNGGLIGRKSEIEIMADSITIAVGQTVELQISSTLSKLNANYNDYIDVYWNNGKTSGDTYYLEVTGVAVGICYLKVNDYNDPDTYDTVEVNIVASEEDVQSVGSPSDFVDAGPVYTTISIPPIVPSTLSVDQIPQNTVVVESASMLYFSGNISSEDQQDFYYFEAPYDGRYRIDLSDVQSGTSMELYLFDASGNKIVADTYCTNGEGITAKGLTAGETYEIRVCQSSGFSSYDLTIGLQKPTVDISSLTQLTDSIEFIDQRNVYLFTVPIDGRYRFELSGMMSGTATELYVFNSLGEEVASNTYCENGEGVTVKGLLAGEVYQVQVRYVSGFSSYNLTIGQQKPTVDISSLTQLTDSIEYTDQRNVYLFTVPIDGRYRFELSGMMSGTATELYVFNRLDEEVAANTYCENGEGVTVKGLLAGEVYQVQVRYVSGHSSYNLLIGQQKETIDVGNYTIIDDSIEYTDQRNVYSFSATASGDITFSMGGLTNEATVQLLVFNALRETVVEDTYCRNGDEYTIENVNFGTYYEIQVRYGSGPSKYELTIN